VAEKPEKKESLTRRSFLEMIGAAGGASAVYETMVAMGLMATPPAAAAPLQLGATEGQGKTVLVLGAGVAGLTAAYRLKKAGYIVSVIEASDRIGGRNFTVSSDARDSRNVIRQNKRDDQICKFDKGLYFEAGCGRIPYHHTALLALCRELEVTLETYIMETRANRFQTPLSLGGKSTANRRIANDTRGYVAELLAKAIDKGALDAELPAPERELMRELLPSFGKIDPATGAYKGSPRIGYVEEPGVVDKGVLEKTIPREDLLKSKFWEHRFYQPEDYEWQTTLFQPVGGMRRIVDALASKVFGGTSQFRLNAPVKRITNGETIQVTLASGEVLKGDYCISTIPCRLLRPLLDASTFTPKFVDAVATPPLANTCKVGWQAKSRFWEDLEGDRIFGGISWINHPVTQIWYPSDGFFQPGPAILTGTYNYDSAKEKTAQKFGEMELKARLETALQGGELLHPTFRQWVPEETGLSIAWQQVPYLEGGWADWNRTNPTHKEAYETLLSPAPRFQRFFVAGDQISYVPGWQEGAVLSADHVIRQITGRAALRAEQLTIVEAPSAADVTGSN